MLMLDWNAWTERKTNKELNMIANETAVLIDPDNWSREVLDAETPVLVDFSAEWCGPCRSLEPIVDELALEFFGKIKVARVDVDDCPELTRDFDVRSIPTLVLLVEGEEAERMIGLTNKDDLETRLRPYVEAA